MQDHLATFPFLILRHRKILSGIYVYIYIFIINNVQLSRVAGTMVARSSSVRAVARSNLSQVPPLHMHVGK